MFVIVTMIDRSKDVEENDENGEDYSKKWDSKMFDVLERPECAEEGWKLTEEQSLDTLCS